MNPLLGGLTANPQQMMQNLQTNPMGGLAFTMVTAASMTNPAFGQQMGFNGVTGQTTSGQSTAPVLGTGTPDLGALGTQFQPFQQPQQAPTFSGTSAPGQAQSQGQSQPNADQWQALISMIMQKLGMSGAAGFGSGMGIAAPSIYGR
jgi:hypothetical protein